MKLQSQISSAQDEAQFQDEAQLRMKPSFRMKPFSRSFSVLSLLCVLVPLVVTAFLPLPELFGPASGDRAWCRGRLPDCDLEWRDRSRGASRPTLSSRAPASPSSVALQRGSSRPCSSMQ